MLLLLRPSNNFLGTTHFQPGRGKVYPPQKLLLISKAQTIPKYIDKFKYIQRSTHPFFRIWGSSYSEFSLNCRVSKIPNSFLAMVPAFPTCFFFQFLVLYFLVLIKTKFSKQISRPKLSHKSNHDLQNYFSLQKILLDSNQKTVITQN